MGFLEADDVSCLSKCSDVTFNLIVFRVILGFARVNGERINFVVDDPGMRNVGVEGAGGPVGGVGTHLLRSVFLLVSP